MLQETTSRSTHTRSTACLARAEYVCVMGQAMHSSTEGVEGSVLEVACRAGNTVEHAERCVVPPCAQMRHRREQMPQRADEVLLALRTDVLRFVLAVV